MLFEKINNELRCPFSAAALQICVIELGGAACQFTQINYQAREQISSGYGKTRIERLQPLSEGKVQGTKTLFVGRAES